jgi:hypothetical protein
MDKLEEIRQKELETQKKQLFAQRVTAVASVASAVAAHKQAATTEEIRKQIAVDSEREAKHQTRMAAYQREMADDQRLTNFRNTVLTTLPLLKDEEEKTQYLTEQLLPELQDVVDVDIYGPFELIQAHFESEGQVLTAHIENEAGFDLDKFLADGSNLMTKRNEVLAEIDIRKRDAKELENAQTRLREVEKGLGVREFFKTLKTVFLLYLVLGGIFGAVLHATGDDQSDDISTVSIVACAIWIIAPIIIGVVAHRIRKMRYVEELKSTIRCLTPKDDGSELRKKDEELQKEIEHQDEIWKGQKPAIVEHLVNKFQEYINGDAQTLLVERVVVPQIESPLQEIQSFLPPSLRLPAKHFAKFFFDESTVEEFRESQLTLRKKLESSIEPSFKDKTMVLVSK